ncbi:hypothetical protein DRN73_01740 [Candidatus Pacearchaeota archaeon]|nr:MAG: hypothetical protein DRN73_01740 [Candidatus Pacearchaeota archaeon]
MDMIGIYIIIFGLILLIAPNISFLPIFKRKSVRVRYTQQTLLNPIWYKLFGILAIILGSLEFFGIINIVK